MKRKRINADAKKIILSAPIAILVVFFINTMLKTPIYENIKVCIFALFLYVLIMFIIYYIKNRNRNTV